MTSSTSEDQKQHRLTLMNWIHAKLPKLREWDLPESLPAPIVTEGVIYLRHEIIIAMRLDYDLCQRWRLLVGGTHYQATAQYHKWEPVPHGDSLYELICLWDDLQRSVVNWKRDIKEQEEEDSVLIERLEVRLRSQEISDKRKEKEREGTDQETHEA